MRTLVHLLLLAALGYSRTQGQVISKPDDVTVCVGKQAVFTCVLNSNMSSDDVQWYRFIKDTSITEMVDPYEENFYFTIDIVENDDEDVTNSSLILTITSVAKSFTGYFWVETMSLNVCNASLTVLAGPSALTVNVTRNSELLSVDVLWAAVDDFLNVTCTVNWTSDGIDVQTATLINQTSYTITGLTLDTVYTITVRAANMCGQGPEYSTTVSFPTVISEPNNVAVCEGKEAVFTCGLNSYIKSNNVQWYRFIKDTSTTVIVNPDGDNINFSTDTVMGNATNISLTITNVIKSYTGYFWVGTSSLNVCNASLTVLTGPPALKVNIMINIENSSIVVQWDVVEDSRRTIYTVTWYGSSEGNVHSDTKRQSDQTSYEITGLTLNTVYSITVFATFAESACGSGPKFTTSIILSTNTTPTSSSTSPTVTVATSTNPVTIISTAYITMMNPKITSTNSMNPITNSTNSINPSTNSTNSMNPSTNSANSINPSTNSSNSINPSTTSANSMITTSIDTVINNGRTTTIAVNNLIITISTDILLLSTSPAKTTMADNNSESSNIFIIAGAVIGGIIAMTIVIVLILVIIVCCCQQRSDTEKNNYNDLSGDDTLTKDIPVALNPLNANEKPEAESSHQISTTTEVLYMTSDIGNKKLPPYKPTESAPQNGRKDTQHQQFMEYAEIDIDNKKIEDKQQNGGAGTQHQQPMEYAVVDKSKKKNRKGDKQQNADDEAVSSSIDHANANQNKINPMLHYADLEVLPPGTGALVTTDESRTPYALVAET